MYTSFTKTILVKEISFSRTIYSSYIFELHHDSHSSTIILNTVPVELHLMQKFSKSLGLVSVVVLPGYDSDAPLRKFMHLGCDSDVREVWYSCLIRSHRHSSSPRNRDMITPHKYQLEWQRRGCSSYLICMYFLGRFKVRHSNSDSSRQFFFSDSLSLA